MATVGCAVCIFCYENLTDGFPEELYAKFRQFFKDRQSFECVKCQKKLEDSTQMFSCPASNNLNNHPLPFLLCFHCNDEIANTQRELESDEMKEQIIARVDKVANMSVEMKLNKVYSDIDDFSMLTPRAADIRGDKETIPRCLVLGATGVGKSSLLNKMAGVKYVYERPEKKEESENEECDYDESDESDDDATLTSPVENKIQIVGGTGLFRAEWVESMEAITSETAFSDICFLGDDDRHVIVIDTPGTNDPDIQRAKRQEIDLNQKLQKAGQISVILVILARNILDEMRMDVKTLETLREIQHMFCGSDEEKSDLLVPKDEFWDHVVVGISKCDEWDYGWQIEKEAKLKTLRKKMRELFRTKGKISVLPLSAIQEPHVEGKEWKWSQQKSFNKLWKAICQKTPIITKNVRVRQELRLTFAETERQLALINGQLEIVDLFRKLITRRTEAENNRHAKAKTDAENTAQNPWEGLTFGAYNAANTVWWMTTKVPTMMKSGVDDIRKGSYAAGAVKTAVGGTLIGAGIRSGTDGATLAVLAVGAIAMGTWATTFVGGTLRTVSRLFNGRLEAQEDLKHRFNSSEIQARDSVLLKKESQILQQLAKGNQLKELRRSVQSLRMLDE